MGKAKNLYEKGNHLQNALVTISDKKLGVDANSDGIIDYYTADVITANDYYPFGMTMPGRKYTQPNTNYRYGFNGKEKDNEIKGENNSYDYGARIYDSRLGRWLSVDPSSEKYAHLSPYNYSENSPIALKDPDGKDGIITISGNTITVHSTIYLYGSGATKATAQQMQNDIMGKWSVKQQNSPPVLNQGWSYTDPATNKVYNVQFDVSVKLYQDKQMNDPMVIPEAWDPENRDNFIEVGATLKEVGRSYVKGGDEGKWRGVGRGNLSLANDDPAPHEFGHLLGLDDKYFDTDNGSSPNWGWFGNIMAESIVGKVEQKTINAVVQDAVVGFNKTLNENKKLQTNGSATLSNETVGYNLTGIYTYEIDVDKPNK